jgi:hypothetical protein
MSDMNNSFGGQQPGMMNQGPSDPYNSGGWFGDYTGG